MEDLKVVAPMALRLRQSPFMIKYFKEQDEEEKQLNDTLDEILDRFILKPEEGKHGEENDKHESRLNRA